MPVKGLMTLK